MQNFPENSVDPDENSVDLGSIPLPEHSSEAMCDFLKELRAAGYRRRTRSDSKSADAADLECVAHAVTAVLDFVKQTLPPEQNADMMALCQSLLAFGAALTDLQNGRAHEMFRCAKKERGGAPPLASGKAVARANAARALDLFVEGGAPLEQAAKRVADAVNARRRGPRITARQVEKWRETYRAGDRGLPCDLGLARFREPLPPEAGETPTEQASWILQHFKMPLA